MRRKEPPPQPRSRLFRPGKGRDYFETNACLNYMDASSLYIRGYQEAADILIEHVERTGNHQDPLVFPIIYLFRHHFELLMKSIITTTRAVLDRDAPTGDDLSKTHDLGKLWNCAKPLIEELGEGQPIRDDIKEGDRVFAEFQRFDKKAETFRFAKSKDGKPHLKEFRLINIRIFRDECGRIAKFLEGVSDSADDALQLCEEMEAELPDY